MNAKRNELFKWLQNHVNHDSDGCLLWPFAYKSDGYGMLTYKGRIARANRVMCELVKGKPEEGQVCRHSCNNKSCLNPKHLFWGTYSDNIHDRYHGFGNH